MGLSISANQLTGLHTKGGSNTKENQEKSETTETLRNSVVLLVCGSKNRKGKDRSSQESCEEARDIGHVIKLQQAIIYCDFS